MLWPQSHPSVGAGPSPPFVRCLKDMDPQVTGGPPGLVGHDRVPAAAMLHGDALGVIRVGVPFAGNGGVGKWDCPARITRGMDPNPASILVEHTHQLPVTSSLDLRHELVRGCIPCSLMDTRIGARFSPLRGHDRRPFGAPTGGRSLTRRRVPAKRDQTHATERVSRWSLAGVGDPLTEPAADRSGLGVPRRRFRCGGTEK